MKGIGARVLIGLLAACALWGMSHERAAAQGTHRTERVKGGDVKNVTFSAPGTAEWCWRMTAVAETDWEHIDKTQRPSYPPWVPKDFSTETGYWISTGVTEDSPERHFQVAFSGLMLPQKPQGGRGGAPAFVIEARTDSEYFVLPSYSIACVGQEVALRAVNEEGEPVMSNWQVAGPQEFSGSNTETITFTPTEPGEYLVKGTRVDSPNLSDIARVAINRVDLDGDFNHDANVDASDPDDPEEHTSPGLLVGMNLDDDNSNSTADKDDASVSGENDLVRIHLDLLPPGVDSGVVILGAPAGATAGGIKVWRSSTKGAGNLILDSTSLTGWKKEWPLSSEFTFGNIPADLYVEGIKSSRAYADVSLVLRYENPRRTLICSDKIAISVAKAFAGRRMTGWGDAHVDGIASSIQESLSYETEKTQRVSKADAINSVPARFIWYTFSHGLVDAAGDFKAVDYGDPFSPSDVPAGGDYLLVFLNGCCSAQISAGSNANAFMTAFGADTYIGWKTTIMGGLAAVFAEEFFSQLDGSKTVTQAINATIGTYTPGSYAHTVVVNNIRVIGNGNLVVDLSP
jgi:hypothetical protein